MDWKKLTAGACLFVYGGGATLETCVHQFQKESRNVVIAGKVEKTKEVDAHEERPIEPLREPVRSSTQVNTPTTPAPDVHAAHWQFDEVSRTFKARG